MNLHPNVFFSTLLLLLATGAVRAEDEAADFSKMADTDKAFLDSAATTDRTEIELSRLAVAKSHSPTVRSLAQQLMTTHDRNLRDLQTLSSQKNYVIAPDVDAGHRQVLRKLQAGSGDDAFDQIYIDTVAADQADFDNMLDRVGNSSNDADLKKFAADSLVTLRSQEQATKDLARR